MVRVVSCYKVKLLLLDNSKENFEKITDFTDTLIIHTLNQSVYIRPVNYKSFQG